MEISLFFTVLIVILKPRFQSLRMNFTKLVNGAYKLLVAGDILYYFCTTFWKTSLGVNKLAWNMYKCRKSIFRSSQRELFFKEDGSGDVVKTWLIFRNIEGLQSGTLVKNNCFKNIFQLKNTKGLYQGLLPKVQNVYIETSCWKHLFVQNTPRWLLLHFSNKTQLKVNYPVFKPFGC